ncbi:O-antigen ligase family protein [Candidatus Daviesbacteria bacterium]|nr:O-antigen ligase family protein [Candidatus Daviesbacteria bacterium]
MVTKILTYSFYLLFFLTPLLWTPLNYELFEYNKMMFVYLLTVIIIGSWILKMVLEKKLLIKKTPFDIPLLLFLLANFLSTIFSIDPHTSVWGYYSRSNGGLLSILSYTLLYFALVANFEAKDAIKFLKIALFGGLVVALYAIPEHFGVSPSCVALSGQFTANCWVQDVQARVFATLGQPNWLAAYLAMLIFPNLYFLLQAKTIFSKIFYGLTTLIFYLGFTFTYSRGGTLGLLAGLILFIVFLILGLHPWGGKQKLGISFKPIGIVLVGFLLINILFGSALTRFKLFAESSAPKTPTSSVSVTQLENGGTESGQIRLIVWKGAIEIFKHYPIFGSGVETFAYSYYNFRPAEHNLVSEWDFLYNKAHNEFLNYLATTGLIGILSYLTLIATFIIWSIKKILKNQNSFLILSLLASYLSYLIQNIFGFSVVIIALFFFIFPGLAILTTESTQVFKFPNFLQTIFNPLINLIYKKSFLKKVLVVFILLIIFYLIFSLFKFWLADTIFAKGSNYSTSGNAGRAYNELIDAASLNPGEPFYRNELGYAAAAAAVALADQDSTRSAQLKEVAVTETNNSLNTSPKNVSFYRTAIRTYYQLASIDPSFNQKTLDALDQAISLAPTDAKLYYNKALILGQLEKNQEGIDTLNKAIALKPDYRDAYYALGVFYQTLKQNDKAIEQMNIVLKLIPNDPDALKKLKELQVK